MQIIQGRTSATALAKHKPPAINPIARTMNTTAAIRRAVVKDDSLSATAKNVKIITANGTVTLRGPVKTEAEKTKIAELAQSAAGNAKIDNQLEVKASK